MIYDLIVLGGGPGGYLAAERAGHAGLKTLLIEKNNLGGVCLNEGCIPSKTLLNSAKIFDYMTGYGEKYGVSCFDPKLDHAFVINRKNKVVKKLVSGVKAALRSSHVDIVKGKGIINGKTAEGISIYVNKEKYIGRRLIIATGSQTIIPQIPGIKEGIEKGFALTSKEILDLDEIPENLVVVGGGIIGLEMTAYYSSAGSKVTVIDMMPQIAGVMDMEITEILRQHFCDKGVKFYLNASVTAIEPDGVLVNRYGKTQKVLCDKVLISIGRRAVTDEFGLENLNVRTTKKSILVDEQCLTSIPNVYAIGDCNGRSMLAHSAYRQAEVAVNNILGKKDIMRYNAVPSIIYTNPEVATVGLTEASAKEQNIDIKTIKLPMTYSGRYIAENEGGNGICKMVFNKKHKTLIGAHVIGGKASEFILSCGMMIEMEMTTDSIKKIIFPHPTVAEIIKEAIFKVEL